MLFIEVAEEVNTRVQAQSQQHTTMTGVSCRNNLNWFQQYMLVDIHERTASEMDRADATDTHAQNRSFPTIECIHAGEPPGISTSTILIEEI